MSTDFLVIVDVYDVIMCGFWIPTGCVYLYILLIENINKIRQYNTVFYSNNDMT